MSMFACCDALLMLLGWTVCHWGASDPDEKMI